MRQGRICTMLAVVLATPLAGQADDDLTGAVELGYRSTDVDGTQDKYREDVNLSDGALRLFDLELDLRPASSGSLDRLTLEAHGLGGEPHSSARLRLAKAGRYELDLRHRSSDFFYMDPGYFFRDGGDLHTWDARRTMFDLGLRVQATERIRLRLGAERTEREGRSTSSRHLQGDEFVLLRPVDHKADTYWVAADFRAGWADVTIEERLASHEKSWFLLASGTDGEEPGAAFLDDYRQARAEDGDMAIHRVSVRGRPHDRLRFSVGYAMADGDLDYDVAGDWSGVDFAGLDYATTLTNRGTVERESDVMDLDLSVKLHDELDLLLDVSRRSYDQDGTIDYLEVQTGGADAGQFVVAGSLRNEVDIDRYGFTLDWRPTRKLSLAAGAGRQQRTADFALSGPEVETERTVYRGRVRWRPNRTWDLRLDLEQDDDQDPLTAVSPTTIERIRFAANLQPAGGLRLSFLLADQSRKNDLSIPLGLPTDDVPPADEIFLARLDTTTAAFNVSWSRGPVDLVGGYARSDLEHDAHIVFVTGSTFVPVFDVTTTRSSTAYRSDQDVVHGVFRYGSGERWEVGARAVLTDNAGSFPVDSAVLGLAGTYRIRSGVHVRVAFDRYDYDEDNPFAGDPASPTPDINDYEASIWTVALGYRF